MSWAFRGSKNLNRKYNFTHTMAADALKGLKKTTDYIDLRYHTSQKSIKSDSSGAIEKK